MGNATQGGKQHRHSRARRSTAVEQQRVQMQREDHSLHSEDNPHRLDPGLDDLEVFEGAPSKNRGQKHLNVAKTQASSQ